MYILRHPKGGLPPLSVARTPAPGGQMQTLSTVHAQDAILRDGADCIVVYVTQAPVELLVSAYLPVAGAAVPAIKIDEIALEAAPALAPAPAPPQQAIVVGDKGLSIIGHIELTGDVVAAEGQHLGEPAGALRLEGFQVVWPDRPEGVDLSYGIAVEGAGAGPVVQTGKFCGTRGQARRITEVTFALVGPRARQFELDGEACFSGGFRVAAASGIALSGPSGLEHLTALSLRVLPAARATAKAEAKAEAKAKPQEKNPWDESARTKVFKTKDVAPKKSKATTA